MPPTPVVGARTHDLSEPSLALRAQAALLGCHDAGATHLPSRDGRGVVRAPALPPPFGAQPSPSARSGPAGRLLPADRLRCCTACCGRPAAPLARSGTAGWSPCRRAAAVPPGRRGRPKPWQPACPPAPGHGASGNGRPLGGEEPSPPPGAFAWMVHSRGPALVSVLWCCSRTATPPSSCNSTKLPRQPFPGLVHCTGAGAALGAPPPPPAAPPAPPRLGVHAAALDAAVADPGQLLRPLVGVAVSSHRSQDDGVAHSQR